MSTTVLRRTVYASALLAWAYSAGGCVAQPSQSSSTDAGASVAPGVSCAADPTSGVTLCVGTNRCPGVSMDPNALPNCGFKTVVPSYDLECVCNGTELCPIGVASSCAEITTLLSNRTAADVCNQAGTGVCKDLTSGTTTGAAGSTSSTCDTGCRAECAGSAACIAQVCGC